MTKERPTAKNERRDAALDPECGPLVPHHVGTAVGAAAGGAAAGAAIGTVAGPIGTAIGAAAGTLVGALAGRGVAETINPAQEDEYWCDTYKTRSYVDPDMTYADYGPAYRYGVESYGRHHGRDFDAVEPELGRGWEGAKGNSRLTWERAQHATKDAWRRLSDTLERATPGDSDGDHK